MSINILTTTLSRPRLDPPHLLIGLIRLVPPSSPLWSLAFVSWRTRHSPLSVFAEFLRFAVSTSHLSSDLKPPYIEQPAPFPHRLLAPQWSRAGCAAMRWFVTLRIDSSRPSDIEHSYIEQPPFPFPSSTQWSQTIECHSNIPYRPAETQRPRAHVHRRHCASAHRATPYYPWGGTIR